MFDRSIAGEMKLIILEVSPLFVVPVQNSRFFLHRIYSIKLLGGMLNKEHCIEFWFSLRFEFFFLLFYKPQKTISNHKLVFLSLEK